MRLDKLRADPARDAPRLAELRPLEQRYWRHLAERKGARDARLEEFRWWLEELRVGLFAQELRTPQPVSVKRLEKTWAQAFRLSASHLDANSAWPSLSRIRQAASAPAAPIELGRRAGDRREIDAVVRHAAAWSPAAR